MDGTTLIELGYREFLAHNSLILKTNKQKEKI